MYVFINSSFKNSLSPNTKVADIVKNMRKATNTFRNAAALILEATTSILE